MKSLNNFDSRKIKNIQILARFDSNKRRCGLKADSVSHHASVYGNYSYDLV